jgi:hypothetical protein
MVSAKFPSSNPLQWLKRLQPSWLAGILSVGFHGVLFAAGPSFPSLGFNGLTEPERAAEKRNVPLVELSPAEQQRLPDFDQSFYSFDSFEDLEPLTPLFESDTDMDTDPETLLPKPGRSLLDNPPLPTPSSRIPFGITSLEPRPRRPTTSLPPLVQTPRPLPQPNTAAPGAGTPPPELPAGTNPQPNTPETTATRQPAPDEPSAADLELRPVNPDENAADESPAIAARGNPTEVLTLEERLLAYSYDVAGTTEEDAVVLWDDWLAAGQDFAEELELPWEAPESDEPDEEGLLKAPIELPIDYTQQFCLAKEPHKGLIGAWVSPEGLLLGEPFVLRSTGYSGLNRQAMQYIKTLDFSTVQAFTGYQFEVVVDYDPENCTELGRLRPATPTADDGARDRALSEPLPGEKPTAESETAPVVEGSPEDSPEDSPPHPTTRPETNN